MDKIVCHMTEQEAIMLQRTEFEIFTAKNMVSFYTEICKKYNTPEMLECYIRKYDEQLRDKIPMYRMLVEEIVKKYMPKENYKSYMVSYSEEEVVYYYE